MQTVDMARKLSHDFKLAARTAPEIYEVVNHLVLRAAADGVKFRRRKIGVEAAVNAILLDFLDKPEAERLAVLVRNVSRFETLMEDDGRANGPGVGSRVDQRATDPPVHISGKGPARKTKSG
jgi:hypothetical protein